METNTFILDANYPGGNILVDDIAGAVARIEQDLRDTSIWWFYWNFSVRNAQGRSLTFVFADERMPESIRKTDGYTYNRKSPIGTRGPAISRDQGRTWEWLGVQAVDGCSFRYAFGPAETDIRFCFSIPYQETHLQDFLGRHAGNPNLSVQSLCQTAKGRTVERIHLGCLQSPPKCRALFTARHHCCEMIASYAIEGLMEATLCDPEMSWLRSNVEVMIIPFVDKDGVEDGDQGKSRIPRDHNRDYNGKSLYASTRTIREFVPHWSEGRLRVAMDLHCPTIRGEHNEKIYIVGSEAPAIWKEQARFGEILQATRRGPLPYLAGDNLPFGQAWNTRDNFASGKTFGAWAAEQAGVLMTGSFEIPYANVKGETVTAGNSRAFGCDLARAVQQYLQSAT